MIQPPEDPRALAYTVISRVEEEDAYADRVLDANLRRQTHLEARDRGLVTEIVYGVLRRRGTLDRCLQPHVKRPLSRLDPEILRILRLGAYQILFLDRVPDHAAVNESVNLSRRHGRPGTGSLVNAVLRSLCRNKEKLRKESLGQWEPDFPDWLVRLWTRDSGRDRAGELFRSLLEQPKTVLRLNPLKTDRDGLMDRLGNEGFVVEPVMELPGAVLVVKGGDLRRAPCFQEGWCVQQDAASQVVVDLLDPHPGETVLDLCAAPGIKTTQAAGKMNNQGLLVAVDIHSARLRELSVLCSRMGVTIARAVCADAGNPGRPCFSGAVFDRILVDAPCSGLGVLRRNPEKKWRPAPDFTALQGLQENLLRTAALVLREGGILVYSTCTLNREENEAVVEAFLEEHTCFVVEDVGPYLPSALKELSSPDGFFRSWNMPSFSDLFFSARLKRLS